MGKKLRLEGFPTACSKAKAELFIRRTASQHRADLAVIDFKGAYAELTFVNESDIDTFVSNLTQFSFGGVNHTLKTLINIERQDDNSQSPLRSSMPVFTPSPAETSGIFTAYHTMPSMQSSIAPTPKIVQPHAENSDVQYEHDFFDDMHSLRSSMSSVSIMSMQSQGETFGEEEQFFDSVSGGGMPPAIVEFSKTHTWFDFKDISAEQNNVALLVHIQHNEIGHSELQKYFESRESRGGPIKKIILMKDGVLVIFHHQTTVENVLTKRVHKIIGKQIKLYRKIIPEVFRDRLVLKNTKTSSLSDEEKLMEIGNISSDLPQPVKIEPSTVENISKVMYNEPLGDKDFQDLIESAKDAEFDGEFEILPLPKTDCIVVEGLPKEIDARKLKIYLQNKAYSNGAVVTRIDRSKDGLVLVYFASYKDVEDILQKYGEKGANLFQKTLSMKPYFHCLSNDHKELEEEHKLDTYSKTMLDKEVAPMCFEFSDINSDVVKFVSSRPRFFRKLEEELSNLAKVEAVDKSGSRMLKITPFSAQVAKDQEDFKGHCTPLLRIFFSQYVSKEYKQIKLQHLQRVRDARLHQNLHIDGVDDEANDYNIRWDGNKHEILVVTGLIGVVDTTIESIVSLTDISNDVLSITKGKYRWLMNVRGMVKLNSSYGCAISPDHEKCTLTLSGAKKNTTEACLQILKMTAGLKMEKFDSLDKDQESFLTDPKITNRIVRHVNDALKQLDATFTVEGNIPYIWCDEGKMDSAVVVLRKILVTDKSLQLTPSENDAMRIDEWKSNHDQLTDKHLVQISLTNLVVVIIGFKDQIEPVKKKIKSYLEEHTITTERFPVSYGKALFIMEFCTEYKQCKNLKEQKFERGAFFVKGKKRPVEKALETLRKQNVVEEKETWQFCKIFDYFVSDQGRKAISNAKSSHKCIILLEEEIPETIDESSAAMNHPQAVDLALPAPKKQDGKPFCEVVKGDITMNQSDVIVNPIGSHFVLSKGGLVCSAIAKKGGDVIQSELRNATGKFIRVTTSGNLPSKSIIHADFTKDVSVMSDYLKEVLQIAEKNKFKTIGIPAIGTGNMHFPPSDIARLMLSAVEDFKTTTIVEYLQKIELVIFDEKILPAFKEVFCHSDSSYQELHASSGVTKDTQKISPVAPSPNDDSNVVQSVSMNERAHVNDRKGDAFDDNSDALVKTVVANITKIGPFTVSVKKGDITQDSSDAIVNSTGQDFDLLRGQVSRQILKKGGDGIQKQLKTTSGKRIRVTDGGKLPCGKIIHVNFPNTGNEMRQCIEGIIETAEKEKCSSLGLPAIGTGNLSLPSAAIAKLIREAIENYASNHSTSQHLNKIDVVVFDEPKLDDFMREIICLQSGKIPAFHANVSPVPKENVPHIRLQMMTKTFPRPVTEQGQTSSITGRGSDSNLLSNSTDSILMGGIKLAVAKGDITAEKTDAIVNSTGPHFDLNKGQVSRIIMKKGGPGIQKELVVGTGKHIRVTSGGKLACGKVIHAVFPGDGAGMKQRVKDVLARADEEKCKTLSLPAVGTGNLNLPSSSIAKLIQEALKEYTETTSTSKHLEEVRVVIFDDSKHSDFLRELITVPKGSLSGAIPKRGLVPPPDETTTSRGNIHGQIPKSAKKRRSLGKFMKWRSSSDSSSDGTDSVEFDLVSSPVPSPHSNMKRHHQAWMDPAKQLQDQVVSKPRDPDSVTMYFYGAKREKVKKAKCAISNHIDIVFGKEEFHISKIDEILLWKRNAFDEILLKSDVKHNIDKNARKVSLSGKKDEIATTKLKIEQLAKELENTARLQSLAAYSWKYLDSKNVWTDFPPLGSTHTEESYRNGETTRRIHLDIGGKMIACVIDLKKHLVQAEDQSFEYRIRRDVKEEIPSHWDDMDVDHNFKQVKLDEKSPEFSKIEKSIKQTVPQCKIESISRIQNKKLYSRYSHELRRVTGTCTTQEIERILFHGTSEAIGDKIAQEGFDRGYSGAHATAFGNGSYFAKEASYSNKKLYAQPNSQNVKTMLVARVITGDYFVGTSGIKSAPTKPGGTEQYNSAVNREKDPTIFVVFVDAGAYPDYMVKYTG